MSIFGIVDQTTPSGQVPISQNGGQFREAVDAATALTDFVNSFATPKNPSDWLAFDTGWSTPQQPAADMRWAYDFDGLPPGLVQIAATPIIEVCHLLCFDDGTDIPITADGSWEVIRRFVIEPDRICPDFNRFTLQPRFDYQSTGGNPKLRITRNGAQYGAEKVLTDQVGWALDTFLAGGVPAAGMNTFTLEGDRVAATLFEIRALVIEVGFRVD